MKDATSLFNWGFDPTGTALGGQSAPSMPESKSAAQGFGHPMLEQAMRGKKFAKEVERRYGRGSNPRGGVFDPRGRAALSPEVADYFEGNMHPWAAAKDFEAEALRIAQGGVPQIAPYRPRTNVNMRLLNSEATGLTPDGARALGDALSQYDPGVVETIAIPRQGSLPRVTNEAGLVTRDGSIPQTYLNQVLRPVSGPDLGDVVARVRQGQPRKTEFVDENGVVHKYAPGTGPYDSPGRTRPGGIAGAKMGTVVGGPGIGAVRSRGGQPVNVMNMTPRATQAPMHGGAPQRVFPSVGSGGRFQNWRSAVGYDAMGVAYDPSRVPGGGGLGALGEVPSNEKRTPWAHIAGGVAMAALGALGVSLMVQGVS